MASLWTLKSAFAGCLAVLLLVGCANIPEEAVTLSVTIGKDLEEVRRSHRELAIRYFERSRVDVNQFMNDVYRPAFVQKALTEATYEYEGDQPRLNFLQILQKEIVRLNAGEEGADPLFYMHVVVDEAIRTTEQTRLELLQPIDAREQEVLRAIDDAYSKVMNAHAIIAGHLASVRRVQQAQDELLADVGLKDIRRKFIDRAADTSAQVSNILAKARKASLTLDELDEKVGEVRELWKEKTE